LSSKPPVKILFFGDSICCGEGTSVYNGWVSKISKYFSEYDYGRTVVVSNASINGDTTRTALIRMGYHVIGKSPDIVVVQFGMNDCNVWKTEGNLPRVSLGSYKHNILEIVDKCFRGAGAKKVILVTNHESNLNKDYDNSLKKYNYVLRTDIRHHLDYFYKDKITLVDIESEFTDSSYHLLSDGIHLNNFGNTKYYDLILPVMRTAVESLL